jgi:hypothetical protein
VRPGSFIMVFAVAFGFTINGNGEKKVEPERHEEF